MTITPKLMILAILAALVSFAPPPAHAGATDPLFINLISDEGHRASMALGFGAKQLKRGHPLTVFLNDRAVAVAAKENAEKYAAQHKAIGELLAAGAVILVCPMCMKHYGVAETSLLPGLKVGNPELTGGQLFKDDTKTLTW